MAPLVGATTFLLSLPVVPVEISRCGSMSWNLQLRQSFDNHLLAPKMALNNADSMPS